jgi:membrane protease YdiL (CAAX protease family)
MSDVANSTEPRWRLRDPLVGYVIAFFLSAIGVTMAISAGATDGTVAEFLGGQAGFWAGLVGIVALASHISGTGSIRRDLRVTSSWPEGLIGVVAGAFTQLVAIPIAYAPIDWFVDDLDLSGEARDLFESPGPRALMIIAIIVIAPIVEELFFRGLLMGALQVRWGNTTAVVGSSVIFAATHFQPLQFPGLVLAGLCFAWMRVRTGRLGPAMWAHAAFNACTVAVLAI